MSLVFNMVGGGSGGGIKLTGIAITTPPTKTAYKVGETFDSTGMVVTAAYSNGATLIATGYIVSLDRPLTVSDTEITVRYTEGGVTKTAAQAITVTKTALAVPSQSGSLTYTGDAQSPVWSGYDADKMILGGATSGTDAGSYNAEIALRDTDRYEWADGTTGVQTVAWSIGKADGTLSLDKTSITLKPDALSGTITVTTNSTGAITASSSAADTVTASVSGNTITVRSVGSKSGTVTVTVSVAGDSNHNAPADAVCTVVCAFVSIYGAEWDGTATTKWSRTDDAANFVDPTPYVAGANSYGSPFDNLMPWSGMVRVTDSEAGELVAIPKFWYKWTQTGNVLKLQIADAATDGFHVSPAHADRGDGAGERDIVYVGRYHCVGNYKSMPNAKPKVDITRSTARISIHKLGSNIWQSDIQMRMTIWMLYLVEFADWDSQKAIGAGCGNGKATENMGYTDSMPYHTGTTLTGRGSYGLGTQYRYIEGLWDNVLDWGDGCYYDSNGLNIITKPSSFSDDRGGTAVGVPVNGWPKAFTVATVAGLEWVIYPTALGGSGTTYTTDVWYFNAYASSLCFGGIYSPNKMYGLFHVFYSSTAVTNISIGCRLQKLP